MIRFAVSKRDKSQSFGVNVFPVGHQTTFPQRLQEKKSGSEGKNRQPFPFVVATQAKVANAKAQRTISCHDNNSCCCFHVPIIKW